MSSAHATGEGVPCPREVWRAAVDGRRITITVQPRNGSPVEFTGDIIGRRKEGNHANTYVTIRFVPDGELAPVEIEAGKENGEWSEFRAFHWKQPGRARGPEDHVYQYVGRVDALHIPGARTGGDAPRDAAASGEGVA